MATAIRTPPHPSSSSDSYSISSLFFRRPSGKADAVIIAHSPDRPKNARACSSPVCSPSPLRRRLDPDDRARSPSPDARNSFQSPSRPFQPITLSFSTYKHATRSPSASPSPLKKRSTRPISRDKLPLLRLQTSSSSQTQRDEDATDVEPLFASGDRSFDTPARTPMTRPPPLSLSDLNAPKAKRRSIEISGPPLPRLVLTPPDVKSKTRTPARLPAPVFKHSLPPITRRASTSPPQTPAVNGDDWFMTMNRESMTKLSLHDREMTSSSPGPASPSFFGGPPIPSLLGGSLGGAGGRNAKKTKAPAPSFRHRRARSGDVPAVTGQSGGPFSDHFFEPISSSSSPSRAVTPSPSAPNLSMRSKRPQPDVWQPTESSLIDFARGLDHPSSDGPFPGFAFPFERGIAQKRSNIGDVSSSSSKGLPRPPRISRLKDKGKARDSGVAGLGASLDVEDDSSMADASFNSMTSVGSLRNESSFPVNFLSGLDDAPFTARDGHDQPDLGIVEPAPLADWDLVTPGFAPTQSSGWPGMAGGSGLGVPLEENSDEEDEGEVDMDKILFNSMQAKQAEYAAGCASRLAMPDTPVKGIAGRLGAGLQRPWQSASKAASSKKVHNAPRKSLPLKFSPLARSSGKSRIFDSPDSEAGDYSPDGADPSPSPSLRTHAHAALLSAPRKSLGNLSHSIGLGRPSTGGRLSTSASANNISQLSGGGGGGLFGKSSSASSGLDMLTSMGITSKRADALRRTSSGAWSFSSESSSDGGSHLGTPTRVTGMLSDWRNPSRPGSAAKELVPPGAPRKSVSFLDQSPTTSRLVPRRSARSPSPSGDSEMLSANSSPCATRQNSLFHRPPSPLPSSPYWNKDDEDESNEDVCPDSSIREEPRRLETQFVSEEGLGAGSFGQAYRVVEKQRGGGHAKPRAFAVKKSKRYEGPKNRLRLLEEYDILKHLTTRTTKRRFRSISLSMFPGSAPSESPNVNVLHFVDGWEQDSMLCIQTEICELGNLSDYLFEFGAKYNRLDEPRLWKIMSELGNGLLHIHHQNVIHLDLKPANVFITIEGRIRIGDFGMASRWPRHPSVVDANASFDREGDRAYMAPEILKGQYGREADVFSFGMIMLECAGNIVVPELGPPWQRLRSNDFSDIDFSGLTPTLVDLIHRLMDPDPAARPLIDQVCGHGVVMKTRSRMLSSMESVRRATAAVIASAPEAEVVTARELSALNLFKASAFGSEGPLFLGEVFGEPEGLGLHFGGRADAMDLTP